jgi:deoxyadenosine/deoxycytidine kinase
MLEPRTLGIRGVVSLQGGIAAGKTTLLQALAQLGGFKTYAEDVESFSQELSSFYAARTRRTCMELEIKVMDFCEATHKEATRAMDGEGCGVVVLERSAYSSWQIFGDLYKEDGLLTGDDVRELRRRAARGQQENVMIYLQTSPETCRERAAERQRREEGALDVKTFDALHEIHERYLNPRGVQTTPGRPDISHCVVIVCGEQPTDDVARDVCVALRIFSAQAEISATASS